MVTVNERLEVIARQLRNDEKPESVTVRTLLSWFGAQRRGYLVVADIRRGLAEHGLETVPDFEFAYIDSLISFQLAQPPIDSQDAHRISAGEDDSVLMSGGVASDPTFRISILNLRTRRLFLSSQMHH